MRSRSVRTGTQRSGCGIGVPGGGSCPIGLPAAIHSARCGRTPKKTSNGLRPKASDERRCALLEGIARLHKEDLPNCPHAHMHTIASLLMDAFCKYIR